MSAVPAGLTGLDITKPGFFLRPDYPELLRWLRDESPVHRLDDGLVLISRYEDIRAISRQPELFSSRHGALVNDPVRASGPDDRSGSILHLDPPIHADWRKLMNREFTPKAAARFEPAIRATTSAISAAGSTPAITAAWLICSATWTCAASRTGCGPEPCP